MDYYFEIAEIKIHIFSEIPVSWNSYIRAFQIPPCGEPDECYECRCADHLLPEGDLIYQNHGQMIFRHDSYEERLHFFFGQKDPCMLYREFPDRKVIFLNRRYLDVFLKEDNYCILNALALEKVLLKHDAVVLHSSFVIRKGAALLFTAPSGTGKSTQAALWERYRGAEIANGDRTILREKGGKPYAWGMPVCGSSQICRNTAAPLRAILYLSQAKDNALRPLDQKEKIKKLISETTINFFDAGFLNQALDIIDDLAAKTEMYHFACTKEEDAVNYLDTYLEEKHYGPD